MSVRLDAIASLIERADTIADVGCDHGLIAKRCLDGALAKKVIASDISEACLDKARREIGNVPNIEYVCCDGIAYECDEAVIAGMGGLLIADIIRAAKRLPKTLIVSPHRDAYECRKTLLSLGYGIDADLFVAERGKYYSVIRAKFGCGNKRLDELKLLFGAECDRENAELRAYLKKLYATYMRAPLRNAEKIDKVTAALKLQGVEIGRDVT